MYTPIRENHLKKMKDETVGFPPVSKFLGGSDGRSAFGQNYSSYQKQ